MVKLCQQVVDGKEISDERKTIVLVLIYKSKGNVMNCESNGGIRLLEHAMKIIERVLEKNITKYSKYDELQFGFMLGKEQLMLFLCQKEWKKSIKRRRKLAHVLC